MAESMFDQTADHLEFLGYELDRQENSIYAMHPDKPNMFLRPVSLGVVVSTYYNVTDAAQENRSEYLEYINTLNRKSYLLMFFANEENHFNMLATYCGEYSKVSFGRFLSAWYSDHDMIIGLPGTEKFIG